MIDRNEPGLYSGEFDLRGEIENDPAIEAFQKPHPYRTQVQKCIWEVTREVMLILGAGLGVTAFYFVIRYLLHLK